MSRKCPLTCQSTHAFIVIRKNKSIPSSTLKEYCIDNFTRYAFVEHKDHIKVDTGEIEGIHYHIVGDFKKNKIPFSTRLNTIVKFFRFDNADGIEIDKYDTFEGALQYLTHKNFADKTQVDKSDIVHNLSKDEFEILYNADIGSVITFEMLYTKCLISHNIVDIIREIGIGNYRTWRQVIWDIWKSLKDDKDFIK